MVYLLLILAVAFAVCYFDRTRLRSSRFYLVALTTATLALAVEWGSFAWAARATYAEPPEFRLLPDDRLTPAQLAVRADGHRYGRWSNIAWYASIPLAVLATVFLVISYRLREPALRFVPVLMLCWYLFFLLGAAV